jgi:hypothetical protein
LLFDTGKQLCDRNHKNNWKNMAEI